MGSRPAGMRGMALGNLRETVRQLPDGPGVYLMRNRTGEVIYVGKASSLRERVRSYFAPAAAETVPKVRRIVAEVDRIEVQETGSELAALLLESRLIKRLAPRYNSQGRGYRSFAFIKVEMGEPFPRVVATRRPLQDGALYLGPFASGRTVEAALDLVHRLFPLRTCDEPVGLFRLRRPCVRGQIGRCAAPCAGLVDMRGYGAVVDAALRFLRGDAIDLAARLEAEMTAAAERLEFERAARLRDDLTLVRAIVDRQALLAEALARRTAVAIGRGRVPGVAELFLIEDGLLAGETRIPAAGRGPLELVPEVLGFLGGLAPRPRDALRPAGRSTALTREDLDELLIVARWLRRLPRASVIEIDPGRLSDEAARRSVAGRVAARVHRVAGTA